MNTITLKPAKDKSLVRRHPWIYANAIEHVEGKPAPGATVLIRTHDGRLWIPMRTALAVINPNELHEDVQPPPVLVRRR